MNEQAKHRLGEILVERGFITADQLQEALRSQYQEGKRLGEILLEMGALTSDELNWALSELLGIPYVEFREEMVDLDLARTMPEELLRRHHAFPVLHAGDELTVILADPTNRQAVAELGALSGATVVTAIASRETISDLLDKAFPPSVVPAGGVRYAEVEAVEAPPETDVTGVAQVYALLLGALREGATEIHLEPLPEELRVRNRVDGRLVERARLPRSLLAPVVARFRLLAGLRGERIPRQAQVRTRLERRDVELELLFFPTLHGEAVTVRIWQRGPGVPTLEALELDRPVSKALRTLLGEGGGLVFVTGSDARARSTLLYALAQAAAAAAKKTVTLERAVSFVIPEFLQVEIAHDFAGGAETVLASPTDVALVEDLAEAATCLSALGAVQQGTLVLGGVGLGTNATSLAHLLALDLPRAPLLRATRGLANVQRLGPRYRVEVLPMTEELRQELLTRQGLWTSRIS